MKSLRILLLLISALLWCSALSFSQETPPLPSVFDYLTRQEGSEIQVRMNLSALLAIRKSGTYLPVTVVAPNGTQLAAEIRPRGRYRRMRCEIPPIKIKFSKPGLAAQGMDTLNEIKVVFPCSDSSSSLDLIVREYLAYRMFERLTPAAFRARLVRLIIIDPDLPAPLRVPAILMEHEEEVLTRLHAKPIVDWGVKTEQLETEQAALVVAYQYFIGNTDWEIESRRNILLVQQEPGGKLIPVPYDFDFSGLVNAPYAVPGSQCGIKRVTDRFLLDSGLDRKAIRNAAAKIVAVQDELSKLSQSAQLSGQAREEVGLFMQKFFDVAGRGRNLPKVLEFSDK